MKANTLNEILVNENDLVNLLLQGTQPSRVTTTDMQAIEQYNHFCNLFMIDGIEAEAPAETNDKYSYKFVENWYMPPEYKNLNLIEYFKTKLMEELQQPESREFYDSKEWNRLAEEYSEFGERGMENLLRYMIYLVDFMRENNIVWGVGRGSSVASYILYLIGVHKIDSIKYDLDFKEFLR
jgi:DNA polymerase III alpha subunit